MNDNDGNKRIKLSMPDRGYRGPLLLAILVVLEWLSGYAYHHNWIYYETAARLFAGISVLGVLCLLFIFYDAAYYIHDHLEITGAFLMICTACAYIVAFFSFQFIFIYQLLGHDHFSALQQQPLDKMDLVYFTLSNLATVSHGDITAVSTLSRFIVASELVAVIGFIALLLAIALIGRGKKHSGTAD